MSDIKDFILRYMTDIGPIKNYEKKMTIDEKYPGYNGLKFDYFFSPLNINQISLNSGFKLGSVMEVLSELGVRMDRNGEMDDKIDLLSYDLFLSTFEGEEKEPFHMQIKDLTNEELIDIAIFKHISKQISEPSDLFSTIFHVKNSLGLPDDFMPGRIKNYFELPPWVLGTIYAPNSYYLPIADIINLAIARRLITGWEFLIESGIPRNYIETIRSKDLGNIS